MSIFFCFLAFFLRVDGVASASLSGLPDDLWRRICAFARPASAHELIVAAGSSTSLRHALQAEVEQTERLVFGMTRGEAEQILTSEGYLFPGSSISKAFLRVLLECRTDVLKETMFMIQDHMRKILQRGW